MTIKASRNLDLLTINSPYWTVLHDLKQGGCVSSVTIIHASGKNLLKAPISASVDKRFFECLETNPQVDVKKRKNGLLLVFSGLMRSSDGVASPVRYEHSYLYTLYSIRNELKIIPEKKFKARIITTCEIDLDKSLDEYTWGSSDFEKVKPRFMDLIGPHYEDDWDSFDNQKGFVFQDGKRPWQVSVFSRGKEGLCFTGDSKQYEWDSPLATIKSSAFSLEKLRDRSRINLSPLKINSKGSEVKIDRELKFSWYLIAPNVRNTDRRKLFPVYISSSPFPCKDQIKAMARSGVNVISFMDDFDYKNNTRNYWRDGDFPPYPPKKMKEMARFLKLCHSYGIKVIPYFAGGILSTETEAFAKHAQNWYTSAIPDGHLRYHPAAMAGTQGGFMCPDSGWIEFLESYIKRCVDDLGFDGYYLDYGTPRVCFNTDHHLGEHNGADGLINMMQNLRDWLGDERIMIAHAGGEACWLMHHNVADGIVTLEEGKKDGGVYQSLEEFPPSIKFMGSAAASLVPNVFFSQPEMKDKQHLLHQGISHGVLLDAIPFPYTFWYDHFGYDKWQDAFSDPSGIYKSYEKLKGIDFTKYKFHGPDTGVASTNRKSVKVATYIGEHDAIIVVSNTGNRKVESTIVKVELILKDGKTVKKSIKLASLKKCEFKIKRIGEKA